MLTVEWETVRLPWGVGHGGTLKDGRGQQCEREWIGAQRVLFQNQETYPNPDTYLPYKAECILQRSSFPMC